MSRVSLPKLRKRIPDRQSERRLGEIRRNAATGELPQTKGVSPAGAPFPRASSELGYYGLPLLKGPQWQKEVPLYLFTGGAAGSAAVIACIAHLLGKDSNDGLVNQARWIAAGGGILSSALLTKDLGMPSRFINMLRVFKPQSPMNMGAWTLAAFSTFSAAAAFASQMRQRLGCKAIYLVENISGLLAGATGVVMASYTGVLIGATAIPVWNANVDTLPAHFAASGMNSAVSILELLGNERRELNLLGLAASAYELFEGLKLEKERTLVNRPLRQGSSGFMVRLGGLLSGPVPLILRISNALAGGKNLRRAAGYLSLAGSLLTRFGWIQAGRASAKDHRIAPELPSA